MTVAQGLQAVDRADGDDLAVVDKDRVLPTASLKARRAINATDIYSRRREEC
jgi:hypothetical protein